MSLAEPHNEFLELCAVSTSGQLTEEEQKKLQEHLLTCESCRVALKQYEAVADQAIPSLMAQETSRDLPNDPAWSETAAEERFFKRLEEDTRKDSNGINGLSERFHPSRQLPPFSSESTWRHVWMLYGAGILLFASLSIYAYRAGIHRGTETAKVIQPSTSPQIPVTVAGQLSDMGHEREITRNQIAERDKIIADLRQQLVQQATQIGDLKRQRETLQSSLQASDASRQITEEKRSELEQKLESAQSATQGLQQRLNSLTQQDTQDAARAKALDAKLADLNRLLHDREMALDQKDELLSHDRDIRELMGARDLYVAEVYDVVGKGTQKPYGRVFYTKGKSLIFYAYDLDRQADLKEASTFQAWGRRGPDREQALNLGIFYEDSTSKKRWILKCDDPNTLEQIDGVFVTVEPNGGSHKPSGKSLLFAYLRVDPNHP